MSAAPFREDTGHEWVGRACVVDTSDRTLDADRFAGTITAVVLHQDAPVSVAVAPDEYAQPYVCGVEEVDLDG